MAVEVSSSDNTATIEVTSTSTSGTVTLSSSSSTAVAVITLDYLQQVQLLVNQAIGFCERAEAGAISAEEAEQECETIITTIQSIKSSIDTMYSAIEADKTTIDEQMEEFNVKVATIDAAVEQVNEAVQNLESTVAQCKAYAESAKADKESSADYLSQITSLASQVSTNATTVYNELQQVIELESNAKTYCDNAIASASSASNSASSASKSESNASTSATSASNSASSASKSESNAKSYMESASSSSSSASTSASNASTSEANAKKYMESASNSASNASTSEINAKSSETNAKISENNASTSESNASTSEVNAKSYMEAASTKATEASTSASNASTSEANALAYKESASASATNASTSEVNAKSYMESASASATSASKSATSAGTSATNAATSEANAKYYSEHVNVFIPSVDSSSNLSWTNEAGLDNPATVNIKGDKGVSCTHSWSGTTLTVTSASGTSSADLKGEKGDKGDTGATYDDTSVTTRLTAIENQESTWNAKQDALTSAQLANINADHSKYLTSHQDISSKVSKSGDTMTGALNFANNTWNKVGDDVYMGDHNVGGCLCLESTSSSATGIQFYDNGGTARAKIQSHNGDNGLSINGYLVSNVNSICLETLNPNITTYDATPTTSGTNYVRFAGADSQPFVDIIAQRTTDSYTRLFLRAFQQGSTSNYAELQVQCDSSGNKAIYGITPATSANDTQLATTAYVKSNLSSYLPLSGGTLTGNTILNMSTYTIPATSSTTSTSYIKLGTWSGTDSAQNCHIKVFTGDGYNANCQQNVLLDITIKDGYQSTASATSAFGVTCEYHGDLSSSSMSNYQVKAYATAYNSVDVYLQIAPNSTTTAGVRYTTGQYTVELAGGKWTHAGTISTSTPSGTLQNCETYRDTVVTSEITAGTAGTSSVTSGSTLAVPYVIVNKTGAVTGYGTHTHTVSGFAASSHTHSYAGASSAGGSATSAVKLDTATAGSATQPCYFANGKPSACTYSLNATVPSGAKFTDTNTTYSAGTGLSLSSTTFNHSNSVTAGTAGTSSATSGSSLAVPYVTYDAQGHITATGTHTHTVSGFLTSSSTLDATKLSGTIPSSCYTNTWRPLCTTNATTTSTASTNAIAVVTTNYVNGTKWYRVWSDGWIEQGGILDTVSSWTATSITLPKAFATKVYSVQVSGSNSSALDKAPTLTSVSTTTISLISYNKQGCAYWYACGY